MTEYRPDYVSDEAVAGRTTGLEMHVQWYIWRTAGRMRCVRAQTEVRQQMKALRRLRCCETRPRAQLACEEMQKLQHFASYA